MTEFLAMEHILTYYCKERERASSPLLCCVMCLLCGPEHSFFFHPVTYLGARKITKLPVRNVDLPPHYLHTITITIIYLFLKTQ